MFATALSRARRITVAALVAAAAGITIQIASGAEYPAVPPGLIILSVATLLTLFVRVWWTAALAAVVGLFLLVGLVGAGQAHRLATSANPGDSFGLWLQVIACAIALCEGSIEAVRAFRARGRASRERSTAA